MPRYPTELPKGPPEPWWQTTSLAELDQTAAVIDQFTRESKEAPPITREQFARAMALQMLCVDEGILDVVIDRADACSESYRPELRPDGDYQKQQAFLFVALAFGRNRFWAAALWELLPETLRHASGPAVTAFSRGSTTISMLTSSSSFTNVGAVQAHGEADPEETIASIAPAVPPAAPRSAAVQLDRSTLTPYRALPRTQDCA
jgi:hypothetical protein